MTPPRFIPCPFPDREGRPFRKSDRCHYRAERMDGNGVTYWRCPTHGTVAGPIEHEHLFDLAPPVPLLELAPAPELLETVNLVLANENGRLDPADDDDQGQTV
ncbi:MAG TPA: hypothetical protein VFJ69_08945 [Actinomycetota bacterium]|jgi:hypothetical protein|nr:hypothetical protein [Actinomycetota bacterium]